MNGKYQYAKQLDAFEAHVLLPRCIIGFLILLAFLWGTAASITLENSGNVIICIMKQWYVLYFVLCPFATYTIFYSLYDRSCIWLWIKPVSKELDMNFHVPASQLSVRVVYCLIDCDAIIRTSTERVRCVRIVSLSSIMSVIFVMKEKIMHVLLSRIVFGVHSSVIFVFIYLVASQSGKTLINTLVRITSSLHQPIHNYLCIHFWCSYNTISIFEAEWNELYKWWILTKDNRIKTKWQFKFQFTLQYENNINSQYKKVFWIVI